MDGSECKDATFTQLGQFIPSWNMCLDGNCDTIPIDHDFDDDLQ